MSTMILRSMTMILVAFLVALTRAATIDLWRRDVFVPPVLYPQEGTVWQVQQHHNVTWDTSNPPVNITNKLGVIMLRKGGMTTPLILADNFDILLGRIEVQVPWVVNGDDYQVVLFGDSGNFSPTFTITGSIDF